MDGGETSITVLTTGSSSVQRLSEDHSHAIASLNDGPTDVRGITLGTMETEVSGHMLVETTEWAHRFPKLWFILASGSTRKI